MNYQNIAAACMAAFLIICPNVANSAPTVAPSAAAGVQSGDIVLEDTKQQRTDIRAKGREEVARWLGSLEQTVAAKGPGTIEKIGDSGVTYLAVFYLYCSVKLGPCPFILDTILQADLTSALKDGEAECPTMNRFWRSWLAGDFEQLVKYKISVANGAALATFNTQHRARYVRCKETVAASIKERTDSASRYQVDDNIAQSIEHSAKVLQGIWDKQIDIFDGVQID